MSLWSKRFISESEGGAPESSPSGQRLLQIRPIISTAHRVYGEPSGVHPSGVMFGGIGGDTPHGVRSTSAVVMRKSYTGIYPLSMQPRIDKPEPWTE